MLTGEQGLEVADEIRGERWLAAPEVIDLEFLQALRGLLRSGQLDDRRAKQAMADFNDLPMRRHGHGPIRDRVWELRDALSAYDAAYVALAEMLNARLVTRDAPLSRAVKTIGLEIDCVLAGGP